MRIDLWSDIVCPWCYIGRARLHQALADFPDRRDIEVVFRSYQLDPAAPTDNPVPVLEMLAEKYGLGPEQAATAEGRVAGLARAEGLPYSGDRLHGNTGTVHRLLHFGADRGAGDQLLDSVYRTHFGGRASIFQPEVLVDLATTVGLDREETLEVIGGDRYQSAVQADIDAASQLGVRGVPFFVFDGRLGVSGAQPTDTLRKALQEVWSQHS
jgi:predicted DsbA family dithiol-disulfide isomerase